MPWKTSSVMEEKLRFVFEHELRDGTMTELCERYEITRQTGYVWLRRYREAGAAGLREHSRAARRHRNQMPEDGGDRAAGVGAAAGAYALGTAEAQAHSGARRARAKLAGGQHHRSAAAARRFGGAAQEARAHSPVHRAAGACRWTQPRVVRGFQGLVPHRGRRAHRSPDDFGCAQPVPVALSSGGENRHGQSAGPV